MSASDQLGRQWFHGSQAKLRVGQRLRPGMSTDDWEERGAQHVYFSDNPRDAARYAHINGWGDRISIDRPRYLYTVEPVGEMELDDRRDYRDLGRPYRAPSARVTRRIELPRLAEDPTSHNRHLWGPEESDLR